MSTNTLVLDVVGRTKTDRFSVSQIEAVHVHVQRFIRGLDLTLIGAILS